MAGGLSVRAWYVVQNLFLTDEGFEWDRTYYFTQMNALSRKNEVYPTMCGYESQANN